MKILILLFGLTSGIGAASKNTVNEIKKTSDRREQSSLREYPNVLPIVEITSVRV